MRPLFVLIFVGLSPFAAIAANLHEGDKVFLMPDAEATVDGIKVDIGVVPVPATVVVVEGQMVSLGKAWVRKGDVMLPEEAFEFFSEQIRLNPANVSAWLNRGLVRKEMGKHIAAEDDFEEVIRLDPKNSMVYVYWGEIKSSGQEAIVNFDEAIRLDPKNARAFFNRGRVRCSLVEKEERDSTAALNDLNEAIILDPDYGEAYSMRALLLGMRAMLAPQKGDVDSAISDYTNVIRLVPKDVESHKMRSDLLFQKGEYAAAIQDRDEVIRLRPTDADAYNDRAMLLQISGDFDGAIRDLTEIVRLRPNSSTARSDRAMIRAHKGEYENAIEDYNAALKANAENHWAFHGIAWLKATCPIDRYRNGKEAIELAMKGCECSKWKHPVLFEALAAAYAEAGDFPNAVKWQQKYLSGEEMANLSIWYEREAAKGKNDLVLAAFEEAKNEHQRAVERLKLYQANKPYRDTPKK